MKKIAWLLIAGLLLSLCLVGCGNNTETIEAAGDVSQTMDLTDDTAEPAEPAEEEPAEEETEFFDYEEYFEDSFDPGDDYVELTVGDWDANGDFPAYTLPSGAAEAFASMTLAEGETLTPVALLGTQVVAGTNYAVLCTRNLESEGPVETLGVAVIYAALDGSAELLRFTALEPEVYLAKVGAVATGLAGGWSCACAEGVGLDETVADTFASCGAEGTPLALLALQSVDGLNYAVLTLQGETLAVLVIYDGIGGVMEVTGSAPFDLADY